ncbi:MAG: hypothetical protein U0670_01275 [Anaerolineae bacterium]
MLNMRRCLLLVCAGLAACSAPPTPLPVFDPVTATPSALSSSSQNADTPSGQVLYGLDSTLQAAIPAADRTQLEPSSELLTSAAFSPADVGSRIDVLVSLNPLEGAQSSPNLYRLSLVLSTQRAPFDASEVLDGVRQTLSGALPSAEWRRLLANAGYPDGFTMALDGPTSLPDSILAALHVISADAQYRAADAQTAEQEVVNGAVHGVIFAWGDPAAREHWAAIAGDANVIDLYGAPLYFLTAEPIEVTGFTPAGFPIAQRR